MLTHASQSAEANGAVGKQVGVDACVAEFSTHALAHTLRLMLAMGH